MIKVDQADEPAMFEHRVRAPGQSYLRSLPAGKKVRFDNREYWRRSIRELHDSYEGICAYTCHYIPLDTGSDTVEHFVPKSIDNSLAYEWANYRLVCGRLNGRKGEHRDVLDPFTIGLNPFHLDFPSLQLRVSPSLLGNSTSLAGTTIKRLKLNDERSISSRLEYVARYCDGRISKQHLSEYAPFIDHELERQGISHEDLLRIMSQ